MWSFKHWVKSVSVRVFSGPYFPALGLNKSSDLLLKSPYSVRMRENKGQKNSEHEHFLRSESYSQEDLSQ